MQVVTDDEPRRIDVCNDAVNQIYRMLLESPQRWRRYLTLARSVTSQIDDTTLLHQDGRTVEQVRIITAIQRMAFADADSGPVPDLDAWVSQSWLTILQRDQQNISALNGIGQVWLSRAQPALARIHRLDTSSSSSGGSGSQATAPSITTVENETLEDQANAEAERRAGMIDFVEARGYLQPATEYLVRAITAASSQEAVSGEMLSTAAEAFMSLGNVSSPRTNMSHFRRAIELLRTASLIDGYSLPRHLQSYLDDFGRLVD